MANEQMTWIQWVQQIAAEIGVECSEDEAGNILYTPYPMAGTSYCEPGVRAYMAAILMTSSRSRCCCSHHSSNLPFFLAAAYCWRANL